MNVCDAAKRAKVSEQTIRAWRRTGRLRDKASWTEAEVDAAAQQKTPRGPKGRRAAKEQGAPDNTTAAAGGPDAPSATPGGAAPSPPPGASPEPSVDPSDPYKLNLPRPPATSPPKEAKAPKPEPEAGERIFSRWATFGGKGW